MNPALIAVGLLCAAPASGESWVRADVVQRHMGTPVQITAYGRDRAALQRAIADAFDRIAEVDRRMSDYKPDSELNRLSRTAPSPQPVPVSDDLFRVLTAADELSRQTGGRFDVTIGPLSHLWRTARERGELPGEEEIQAARDAVGYEALELDCDAQTVRLTKSRMQLDLGAIAKGYAADVALQAMQQQDVTRVLINAGGDLLMGDPPPGRSHWHVAVDHATGEEPPSGVLRLRNMAVATSGDQVQYLEVDDRRYSHIIDPHTGWGLTQSPTVTAVASDAMTADGVASAVSLLGAEDGLRLLENMPGVEGMIQVSSGDETTSHFSSGIRQFLVDDAGKQKGESERGR